LLSIGSGGLVGFTLGLIGGGGSILAVPLLVYVVRVGSPHLAIGTSAVAVAVSALLNFVGHARAGTVKWPCATVFAVTGIIGSAIGAGIGKMIDGQKLLLLFGGLMIVIGLAMLRPRKSGDKPDVRLSRTSAREMLPPLVGTALGVGSLSGFFGIGGGFLIVPGLVSATGMPLINAIGSSLLSVTAFGATAAASYAASDLVDWRISGYFILGGLVGGVFGNLLSRKLASRKRTLNLVFAGVVVAVGVYVAARGLLVLL
jgi:Predicted permeases